MHEDYEDDNYDDYEDSQDNSGGQYKHYFKFDPNAWDAWGKFLYDSLKGIVESSPNVWYTPINIPGFPHKSIPVDSYFSNTGKNKNFQYLGSNYFKEPIYKTQYFIENRINNDYKNHLRSNAVHFVNQPSYYRGMFDILN
jgi:hypothetical protein